MLNSSATLNPIMFYKAVRVGSTADSLTAMHTVHTERLFKVL